MRRPLALVLTVALGSCTPLAVTAVVAGGAATIAGASAGSKTCTTEGCVYTKALGALFVLIGLGLAAAGGIALATD